MSNKSCIQDDDLDETVIFCGAVTDIEKTFQKRMPRHTILPADVKLRFDIMSLIIQYP